MRAMYVFKIPCSKLFIFQSIFTGSVYKHTVMAIFRSNLLHSKTSEDLCWYNYLDCTCSGSQSMMPTISPRL